MSLIHALSALGSSNGEVFPRVAHIDDAGTIVADISPLPASHRKGLVAVFAMAILSLVATGALILFITYRLLFWRSNNKRYIGYNQYVILIYNLVIADLFQSAAFLICVKWYADNKIEGSSAACFLQGFWLQMGDPASGIFVLAIAVHTFLLVAMSRKLSHRVFMWSVIGLWVFVAILVIIPIAAHGRKVFVPSGAWCWINEDYETVRLWTHYFWIFLAEFGTISLYAVLWFQLRRRIKQSAILGGAHVESLRRLRRVIGYMVIYPIAYIVLSLPLAAGRMATAQGNTPSVVYFCAAGALITSSGLVDVLLYTLTRRNLLLESEPSADRSYNRFTSSRNGGGRNTHHTTIIAEHKIVRTDISALRTMAGRNEGGGPLRDGSTDEILQNTGVELAPMGKVYQHTTIEITSEPAYPASPDASERSSQESFRPKGKNPGQLQRKWGI